MIGGLGLNSVINGNFSSSQYWDIAGSSWSIDPVLQHARVINSVADDLSQDITLIPGNIYEISFTVTQSSSASGGYITPYLNGTSPAIGTPVAADAAPATYTQNIVAVHTIVYRYIHRQGKTFSQRW